MRVVNLRARVAGRHFFSRTSLFPRPDPPSARQARGGGPEPWGARSARTRRRAATPRPPGGARTARSPTRPPAPGRRRLADPFAPSEETKYTFVSVPERVRVRRRTLAGLSVCSLPGCPSSHPSTPRGAATTHTGSCPNAVLRPPPPWPVDFAFPALGKAGNGPEGTRPRDSGLRLGRAAFDSPAAPRSPAPLTSPGRARLQSGCESRGRFPTPAAARHSGSGAPRPQDYKSHQAPRHERRCRRRGPLGACALQPPEPASTTPPGGTEGRQKHPRH